MYSFEPSEEQKMLTESVLRWAGGNMRPAAHEADESGALPPGVIAKGWELGLLQASIPETYGGFGEPSSLTGALAAEEMAYGDLAGALAVLAPGLFALPVLHCGSEDQKQALLPPLVEADWQPYTAALLEPRYNFDPNDLRTLATPASSGYCLQGLKSFVPFAAEAAAAGLPMLVYARLSDRTQAFVVPSTAPGLRVIERQKTLGLNALPLYSLAFDDVQLGADSLLGGPDGHDPAPLLAAQQVAVAALGVGLARAALEYSCDYARERQAFGVKIAQKQAIAFMLAEMATEIEAIRLLTWQAAWSLDQLKPEASRLAYLAATGAADMAMQVTDRAVQILGGHGYIREHPVELWMRNGRGIATLAGLAMV